MDFNMLLGILVIGFAFNGFIFGAIYTIGSIIGVVFGLLLAGRVTDSFAPSLGFFFGGNADLTRLIVFLVVVIVVARLFGHVLKIVNKGTGILKFIPLVGFATRLAGAALGLIEGVLVLGTLLLFASHLHLAPFFEEGIKHSWIAGMLMKGAGVLAPLLPGGLENVQNAGG